jgi:hypothetical protein
MRALLPSVKEEKPGGEIVSGAVDRRSRDRPIRKARS